MVFQATTAEPSGAMWADGPWAGSASEMVATGATGRPDGLSRSISIVSSVPGWLRAHTSTVRPPVVVPPWTSLNSPAVTRSTRSGPSVPSAATRRISSVWTRGLSDTCRS